MKTPGPGPTPEPLPHSAVPEGTDEGDTCSIPGGARDRDETTLQAVVREFREEVTGGPPARPGQDARPRLLAPRRPHRPRPQPARPHSRRP
ncbi:NUDIX domain-containing protein [Nocardiopsis sp. LOL_012]|uniref:NUDIX domain-containing protein n=1 Tax=Nocardiopsis sp. LOL_012 TaxID=3345409 RepID=UPI003A8B2F80